MQVNESSILRKAGLIEDWEDEQDHLSFSHQTEENVFINSTDA